MGLSTGSRLGPYEILSAESTAIASDQTNYRKSVDQLLALLQVPPLDSLRSLGAGRSAHLPAFRGHPHADDEGQRRLTNSFTVALRRLPLPVT
jgi:hypothetical protein